MEKLELTSKLTIDPFSKQTYPPKEWVKEQMKRELEYKIGRLVMDSNRKGTICFSQYQFIEIPIDHLTTHLQGEVIYDYARELPVIIHSGFEFDGIPIKAPEQLTFKERVKFIFTGKYPR